MKNTAFAPPLPWKMLHSSPHEKYCIRPPPPPPHEKCCIRPPWKMLHSPPMENAAFALIWIFVTGIQNVRQKCLFLMEFQYTLKFSFILVPQTRPLLVYYELIDSHNQPAGRLQPLTPVPLRRESSHDQSRSSPDEDTRPSNNRASTSSSAVLHPPNSSGRPAQSTRPDYAPSPSSHPAKQHPSSSPAKPAGLHLKIKLTKNGTWQATTQSPTSSANFPSITDQSRAGYGRVAQNFQNPRHETSEKIQAGSRKLDMLINERIRQKQQEQHTEQSRKRPFDQTRDPDAAAPKVAKVHPLPALFGGISTREEVPASRDARYGSPQGKERLADCAEHDEEPYRCRSDPESEILKSTGLVPFAATRLPGDNHNIMSIRRILHGQL